MIQTSIVAPGFSPDSGRRFLASNRSTWSSVGCGVPRHGRGPKTPSIASSVGLMRLSKSQDSAVPLFFYGFNEIHASFSPVPEQLLEPGWHRQVVEFGSMEFVHPCHL